MSNQNAKKTAGGGEELSKRIGRLLERLPAEELAVRLQVSVATVYRWRSSPPKRPLRALLAALDRMEKS